jgi:arsenate reductase
VRRGEVVIYHNPQCSKSRRALELLRERGIEPRVVDYLLTPPDAREIVVLLELLRLRVREIVRTHEPVYRTLGLDAVRDDTELTRAIAANPILLERPIVLAGDRAVIGRPTERIQEIL